MRSDTKESYGGRREENNESKLDHFWSNCIARIRTRRIDKRNDKPCTFCDSLEGLQDSELGAYDDIHLLIVEAWINKDCKSRKRIVSMDKCTRYVHQTVNYRSRCLLLPVALSSSCCILSLSHTHNYPLGIPRSKHDRNRCSPHPPVSV